MDAFTPTINRTSLVSNEVMEVNRYNLKLNSQKLLFGLAQSIDHTVDLFGDIQIDIKGLFRYLEIEERNDRYTIVRDALFDITENPLQKKASEKKWSSIPWMSVEYDEDESTYVKIRFDEKVKPYLLALKEYTKIKGLYIAKLQSHYATWLYPVLKMVQTKYYGKHDISIQRLKEYTFTDDPKEYPSYNTAKSATNNFLTYVVGVKWNTKEKRYEIVKDSPLYEINEKTDIQVSVDIIKQGKKYVGVMFYVQSKHENKVLPSKTDKSKYVNTIPKEGIQGQTRIPLAKIYEYAKASNMDVYDYCEKAGYTIKENFAYKKMSEAEWKRQFEAREKEENKRSYKQMTIHDVIEKAKGKKYERN